MFKQLINQQREFFQTGATKELSFRLEALTKLAETIKSFESDIMNSLKADLNKSNFDAYSTEIGVVLNDIRFIKKRLHKWVKPKRVKTPLTHFGTSSYIYAEPYGVSLIIAPWNFPFQLALAPVIGAIAAGNCAIVKPSEYTPKTSKIIAQIFAEIFPESFISVLQGGVDVSQSLLKEPFDYIFFTGSPQVGKIVMKAAAEHLTPVTLELGGKSPCIVHKDAHIKHAAKRIAWGKYLNAGQTCIAPDYIYVHEAVKDVFIKTLKTYVKKLYSDHPLKNESYTRIIHKNHFNRLKEFLNDGEVVIGGKVDTDKLLIEPTVMTNITWENRIMKEEIFGPILPVLTYGNLPEVYDGIENSPNPLALYLFTENKTVEKEILKTIPFGGGSINDTVYHFANPHLPFGGVGTSGIGAYHGKASFETFSHHKSVLKQTTRFDIPLRYPNVKNGLQKIKWFFK